MEGLCWSLEGFFLFRRERERGMVGVWGWWRWGGVQLDGDLCGKIWYKLVLTCAGCGGQEKVGEEVRS